MNISSSRLASPTRGSPTPTDIQDTQSSHSDQQHSSGFRSPQESEHAGLVHNPNHKNGHEHNRQSLKTEYKSNFKPFDQYVYNELTDSFVKQKSPPAASNHLLIDSANGGNGGGGGAALRSSNQDLASAMGGGGDVIAVSSISPSPALEIGVFEPSNGLDQQHCAATQEPWYKEVVRRNEKANEYRFKSEVGHHSPFANESGALMDEQQQLASFNSAASPAPSSADELSSKRAYKFTAHDYKRDHLIATMANNNNFNLPKEQQNQKEAHEKLAPPPRRVQAKGDAPIRTSTAGASSRTLTRTTASSRARSQSSRRQVAPATASSATSARPEPTSKSNQASPVKSATSRVATSRLLAARTTNATRTQRPLTSTTKTTAAKAEPPVSNGALRSARSATAVKKPPTPNSVTRPTTARKLTTSATPAAASTTQAPQRSPIKRPTGTIATTAPRTRPTTAAPARNSLSRPSASRSGSTSGPSGTTSASNAPKSIKSKALADAGEKAAAALAAAVASAAVVSDALMTSNAPVKPELGSETPDAASVSGKSRHELDEAHSNTLDELETRDGGENYYSNQEPNLIITTTENGNMLADEIARAEREAQEAALKSREENVEHQVNETEPTCVKSETIDLEASETVKAVASEDNQVIESSKSEENLKGDLVNGLSGAIVSAEDQFDANDRYPSDELQPIASSAYDFERNDENDNEEPYSLMPTTFANATAQEEPLAVERFTRATESCEDEQTAREGHEDEVAFPTHDDLTTDSEQALPNVSDSGLRDEAPQEAEPKPESELPSDPADQIDEASRGSVEDHDDESSEKEAEIIEKRIDTDVIEGVLKSDEPYRVPGASEKQLDLQEDEKVSDVAQSEEADNASETRESQNEEKSALQGDRNETEEAEEGQNAQPEQEPLVTKTVDGHKLTDEVLKCSEIDANEIQEHLKYGEFERYNEPESFTVPQELDQKNSHAEQESPIEILDLESDLKSSKSANVSDEKSRHEADWDKFGPAGFNNNKLIESDRAYGSKDDSKHQGAVESNPNNATDSDDDNGGSYRRNSSVRNELLMNVADLVGAEARIKEEMSRKSELARQQSNSRASLSFRQSGEILLSADELDEQFVQTARDGTGAQHALEEGADRRTSTVASSEDEVAHVNETSEGDGSSKLDDGSGGGGDEILPVQQVSPWQQGNSTDDLVNLGPTTTTRDSEEHQVRESMSRDDLMTMDNVDEKRSEMLVNSEFQHSPADNTSNNGIIGSQTQRDAPNRLEMNQNEHGKLSDHFSNKTNLSDEDLMEEEEEERQKLSNHLTNSDDDVILAPRNIKETLFDDDCFNAPNATIGSRYNGGAGLGSLAQHERLESTDSAQLADGSSAELVAESRESNKLMPELGAASMLKQPISSSLLNDFDSDDDEAHDLGLNPNADPIDLAATLSPSSSVAEDLLRLSREASVASITTNVMPKTMAEHFHEPATDQQKVDS